MPPEFSSNTHRENFQPESTPKKTESQIQDVGWFCKTAALGFKKQQNTLDICCRFRD